MSLLGDENTCIVRLKVMIRSDRQLDTFMYMTLKPLSNANLRANMGAPYKIALLRRRANATLELSYMTQ